MPAWLGWMVMRRFEHRLGTVPTLGLSCAARAGLFLVATVVYLTVEAVYTR
jgi:hypothetical protein